MQHGHNESFIHRVPDSTTTFDNQCCTLETTPHRATQNVGRWLHQCRVDPLNATNACHSACITIRTAVDTKRASVQAIRRALTTRRPTRQLAACIISPMHGWHGYHAPLHLHPANRNTVHPTTLTSRDTYCKCLESRAISTHQLQNILKIEWVGEIVCVNSVRGCA